MQIQREHLPRVQYEIPTLKNVLDFNRLWECTMCQNLRISNFLLLMIRFDLCVTFPLIRIRVDFRN